MKDLHGFGLRGHLPNFISNFLQDRSFKVQIGSTFSDSHPQEMGVPQCSTLSVILFSVKINSITQCLKPGVDCLLYVDDFQVCYISSNMSIIEHQLQLCLNKLQQWATDNGFQFSKTKTVCMHICQKRGLHLDPQLFVHKSPIPVVEETKFLGVIFDRKLSFGCFVYGSTHKSYLQMLDPIHNQGLRLCLGAFQTSPVESVYIDAHKPCLGARGAVCFQDKGIAKISCT